ncbi:MAG: UbiA family prenyltransferase [Crenarchaeota archaeon]|nr:UbiA family prenyltransferase [Thermoproteota archaeon]
MRGFRSFMRLTRIEHGLFVGLVPVSTYVLTSNHINVITILVLYFSALLAEIYLFTLNDLCNIAEDRINRPDAPLVTGEVKISEAKIITYISLVSGVTTVVVSYVYGLINDISLAVYLTALVLGTLYNIGLKRTCLIGNVLTSITTSLSFIYGMEQISTVPIMLFFISFIACMGREIIKTIIDIEGDRLAGLTTLPIKYGIDLSKKIAIGSELVASILLMFLSFYVFTNISLLYRFSLLAAGSLVVALLNIVTLFKIRDFSKLRKILLELMFLLIVSYLATALFCYLSRVY